MMIHVLVIVVAAMMADAFDALSIAKVDVLMQNVGIRSFRYELRAHAACLHTRQCLLFKVSGLWLQQGSWCPTVFMEYHLNAWTSWVPHDSWLYRPVDGCNWT